MFFALRVLDVKGERDGADVGFGGIARCGGDQADGFGETVAEGGV